MCFPLEPVFIRDGEGVPNFNQIKRSTSLNESKNPLIYSAVIRNGLEQSSWVQEPVRQPPEKETQTKPKIPPKPVMSSEAAAYPKLFKSYKELKRQNETIFEAEKERNALELERDDLKGLAQIIRHCQKIRLSECAGVLLYLPYIS